MIVHYWSTRHLEIRKGTRLVVAGQLQLRIFVSHLTMKILKTVFKKTGIGIFVGSLSIAHFFEFKM